MCAAARLPPAVPTRYTSSLLQEPHTRGEKISQAFPMKSFPQALSTPSASWRRPPPPGRGAQGAALRPHSSAQTGGPAPATPQQVGGPPHKAPFFSPGVGRATAIAQPEPGLRCGQGSGTEGPHRPCAEPLSPAPLRSPGMGHSPTVGGSGEKEACKCFQWVNM